MAKLCECGNPVFSHGYCKNCQYKRTDKKKPKSLERKPIKANYKPSGEGRIFDEIINERKHICFVSGKKIENPNHSNCHHILDKNRYESFRLVKENIILVTFEVHQLIHFGTNESREAFGYKEGWEKLYSLKQELLKIYKL